MGKGANIGWLAGSVLGALGVAHAACSSPNDDGSSTPSGTATAGSGGAATSSPAASATSSSGGNAAVSSSTSATGTGGAGGGGAAPPVIVQITAGESHSCALTKLGTVYCWGAAGGLGNTVQPENYGTPTPPTLVAGLESVAEVRASHGHTCARKTDGTVLCWGGNTNGQLGDGTVTELRLTPALVPNLAGVTAIAAGGHSQNEHTCALKGDGTVLCWGSNQYGELGAASKDTCWNDKPCSTTPLVVQGLTGVKALTLASRTTCALKTDGTLWCWGYNPSNRLLTGGPDPQAAPAQTQNSFATAFLSVAVGTGAPICGIRSDGMVMCWGTSNEYGEIGCGKLYGACPYDTMKSPIPALTGVAALASGGLNHMHARKADGTVVGWGLNVYGALGASQCVNMCASPSPLPLTGIIDIADGFEHGCALDMNGAVWCWGLNTSGQVCDVKSNKACTCGGSASCGMSPVKF
jgi:alpha-tubulin suppressor-like RCC1 family protein